MLVAQTEGHSGPTAVILDGPGKPRQTSRLLRVTATTLLSSGPSEVLGLLRPSSLATSPSPAVELPPFERDLLSWTLISEGFMVRTEGRLGWCGLLGSVGTSQSVLWDFYEVRCCDSSDPVAGVCFFVPKTFFSCGLTQREPDPS